MNEMVGQVSMFDQDIWCGRMSPEVSVQQKEMTSELSWKSWRGLSKKESQFLDLRRESGTPQESSSVIGGQLLGESRMPNIGAYLNVEEGLHSLLTSEDTMHLALFLENTNPTEAPCEEIPSHLSDILEENPDPKYTLSAKACLGILTRASRRGKKLPPMLEEALIQNVVEETEYGQKGIADTIEILREMRREIGEEALKEWVQRIFVLVQSEDILLGEVCESCEDSEDSNEQVLVEGDGEESIREEGLCELRSNGEIGDTPQRQEPNEQLSEQLDLLMQKLSHENAQKAVIMYCLRLACEGEESVSEALSAIPQGESLGADQYNAVILGDTVSTLGVNCGMSHGRQCVLEPQVAYTLKIRSGCEGGGKGALIQTDKSATLSTLQDQTLFQPVTARCFLGNGGACGEISSTLVGDHQNRVTDFTSLLVMKNTGDVRTSEVVIALDRASYNQGKNAQFDFEVSDKGVNSPLVAKGPGAVCYSIDQGGGKSACNVQEGQAPTLTCTHGGEPAVCYTIQGSMIGRADKNGPQGDGVNEGVSFTLNTIDRHAVVAVDCRNGTEDAVNGALQSNAAHSLNGNNVVRTRYIVRRLTPLECERLQGYPSELKLDVSKMTKDEYIAYNILEGNIIVDAEAGKVYRTRGPGGVTLDKPQEMKGSDCNGYLVLKISNGTTKMSCRVHRIIWISQHGVIPDGYCIDHINSDKKDNRISNLQLLTPQENSTKAAQDGLYATGEDNSATKVSPDLWDEIAYLHHCEGKTMRQLSEIYGISKSRIQQIVKEVGWTDIGEYTDSNGKKRQTSDAARYKALGNSIALPPWKWVLKRLCACYERDATMASLFDGIGGFPYLWEQLNGKGSCLWASEIEEFPMAVTKVRIGE